MYNKHLDHFMLVSDLGSFSKAAEKAFISPNAIIKQINSLEKELGVVLFIRTNQGVTLTEAGKSIYKDTKRIVEIAQQALEKAKITEQREQHTIRIGTSLLRPSKTIVDLWVSISSNYPNINLQITPFDDTFPTWLKILEQLGGKIDVVAGIYPSTFWNNRCQVLKITEYPLCCAVSHKHPLAKKKSINFSDLYGQKLIMVERGDTSYIDLLRDEIELNHPKISIQDVSSYDTQVFNQCESTGSAMITISTWSEVHPSLVTISCDWNYNVPYGLAYSLNPSQKVQNFVEALKST
ncbi:TPA: LysR family transcriptional regulator [Listeria monocytogenes]|nr:LysR family transcriptional regulator [Listeria monocytogenes]